MHEVQNFLGTKALFNRSIHKHNWSVSAIFGQILNTIALNGFGIRGKELFRPLIQLIFVRGHISQGVTQE